MHIRDLMVRYDAMVDKTHMQWFLFAPPTFLLPVDVCNSAHPPRSNLVSAATAVTAATQGIELITCSLNGNMVVLIDPSPIKQFAFFFWFQALATQRDSCLTLIESANLVSLEFHKLGIIKPERLSSEGCA